MQFFLLLLLAWLGSAEANKITYEGYKVFQLRPVMGQHALLEPFKDKPGYDFWSFSLVVGKPVDIMVSPPEIRNFVIFLEKHDIKYTILIDNVAKVITKKERRSTTKMQKGRISFQTYPRMQEIYDYMDKIGKRYPDLVKVETIGKTCENRDIKVLRISRGYKNRSIFIDGGIHAREWISPIMVLYIIHQLVENTTNSALSKGLDWHILPLMNPDGYEYSHTMDRMWRKNRAHNQNSNCRGVDLNRNWGFHWDNSHQHNNRCSQVYAGPQPFSEPESNSTRNYILSHKSHMKLYLTFHSYGQSITYSWGYTKNLPRDVKLLHGLAIAVNEAIKNNEADDYGIGSAGRLIGVGPGGSDDWAKGEVKIPYSYTIELPPPMMKGLNGFKLPESKILPTIQTFWNAMPEFAKYVKSLKK